MTLWAKVKLWAAIAGGAAFIISLLLLRVFTMGRDQAKADNAIALEKAREKFDERISEAHSAGNAVRRESDDPDRLRVDDGYKRKRKAK